MADKAAGDWLKLQVEAARLESDWQSQRPLLESIASALTERVKTQEEKLELAKAKTAVERSDLKDLEDNTAKAREDLTLIATRLKALTARLLALRPNLPPHLSEALEMSYRSLASSESADPERMQVAMTVLNRCAQFNRLVTVTDDVLTLDGEPPAKSYEVIYWGMSHAYAIDRSARKAWLGAPAEHGWRWNAQPEAFAATAKAIAIAQGTADPEFVALPAAVPRLVATH